MEYEKLLTNTANRSIVYTTELGMCQFIAYLFFCSFGAMDEKFFPRAGRAQPSAL